MEIMLRRKCAHIFESLVLKWWHCKKIDHEICAYGYMTWGLRKARTEKISNGIQYSFQGEKNPDLDNKCEKRYLFGSGSVLYGGWTFWSPILGYEFSCIKWWKFFLMYCITLKYFLNSLNSLEVLCVFVSKQTLKWSRN